MIRAVAVVLLLLSAAGARAQSPVPPPAVPQLPDEPLPEWHPPPPSQRHAMFLEMSPEMVEAQKIRQAGLWISSAGWLQLFGGGILFVWANNVNNDIIHPTPGNQSGQFTPALEDKRNKIEQAATAFLGIGGAMAAGGFILYTIGQWRITSHHKTHPNEPLPPLSGF